MHCLRAAGENFQFLGEMWSISSVKINCFLIQTDLKTSNFSRPPTAAERELPSTTPQNPPQIPVPGIWPHLRPKQGGGVQIKGGFQIRNPTDMNIKFPLKTFSWKVSSFYIFQKLSRREPMDIFIKHLCYIDRHQWKNCYFIIYKMGKEVAW